MLTTSRAARVIFGLVLLIRRVAQRKMCKKTTPKPEAMVSFLLAVGMTERFFTLWDS